MTYHGKTRRPSQTQRHQHRWPWWRRWRKWRRWSWLWWWWRSCHWRVLQDWACCCGGEWRMITLIPLMPRSQPYIFVVNLNNSHFNFYLTGIVCGCLVLTILFRFSGSCFILYHYKGGFIASQFSTPWYTVSMTIKSGLISNKARQYNTNYSIWEPTLREITTTVLP